MELNIPGSSFNKSDVERIIRDWITMNLEIRSEGNSIMIGYMRESWSGVKEFREISSCQIPVPIHVDNIRFGG